MPFHDMTFAGFAQFGIAGAILAVFFIVLIFIMRQHADTVKGIVTRMSADHRDSNESWRSTFIEHSNRADSRQAETNAVLRDLSSIMSYANRRYLQENLTSFDSERSKKNVRQP